MPTWLTMLLRWGGVVLAVLAAIALIYFEFLAPAPAEPTAAEAGGPPMTLYWVLLVIGVIAAIIGFAMGRRPAGGGQG